jgi:hypothetical protein
LLAQLHNGAPLGKVVSDWCGYDAYGLAVAAFVMDVLRRAAPTLHSRRQLLEHVLRSFEWARPHGEQWRVINAAGFVGHHKAERPKLVEVLDECTGELRKVESRTETAWRNCPKGDAAGLAEHSDRSPRQLQRYRRTLRAGGLWGSQRPRWDAPDAVLPARPSGRPGGTWAYSHHWLGFDPPPAMVERWKAWEARRLKREERSPSMRRYKKKRAGLHAQKLIARAAEKRWTVDDAPRADDLQALQQALELDGRQVDYSGGDFRY